MRIKFTDFPASTGNDFAACTLPRLAAGLPDAADSVRPVKRWNGSPALLRKSLSNHTVQCIAWHRGTRTQSEILPCNSAECPRPHSQCRCRIIMPYRFCRFLPVRHRQSAHYIWTSAHWRQRYRHAARRFLLPVQSVINHQTDIPHPLFTILYYFYCYILQQVNVVLYFMLTAVFSYFSLILTENRW